MVHSAWRGGGVGGGGEVVSMQDYAEKKAHDADNMMDDSPG
jgi:hypothetical protein